MFQQWAGRSSRQCGVFLKQGSPRGPQVIKGGQSSMGFPKYPRRVLIILVFTTQEPLLDRVPWLRFFKLLLDVLHHHADHPAPHDFFGVNLGEREDYADLMV